MLTSTKGRLSARASSVGGQLVQHVSHHLGFDPQENKIADTGDLLVSATGTAQLAGQGLRFGWCAVGQQHIPGACTLADRTGHCAAHIAAADKTVFHGDPPRILQDSNMVAQRSGFVNEKL